MDDMLTWLHGVLDDLARLATAADADIGTGPNGARGWYLDQLDEWPGAGYVNWDYVCVGPEIAPHIFRHDPRSVLQRVEAERAILRFHPPLDGTCSLCHDWYVTASWPTDGARPTYPCDTIRWLAYGHRLDAPGWRDDWAPDVSASE